MSLAWSISAEAQALSSSGAFGKAQRWVLLKEPLRHLACMQHGFEDSFSQLPTHNFVTMLQVAIKFLTSQFSAQSPSVREALLGLEVGPLPRPILRFLCTAVRLSGLQLYSFSLAVWNTPCTHAAGASECRAVLWRCVSASGDLRATMDSPAHARLQEASLLSPSNRSTLVSVYRLYQ